MARQIRYDAWSPADGRLRREGADTATWTSPWCEPGFALEDLVASWSVTTPGSSWIEVAVQARGRRSWHELGHWASGAHHPRRTSIGGDPEVDTDVWRPATPVTAYRLRLRLHGDPGPEVRSVGAVASAGQVRSSTSRPSGRASGVVDVPRLSQMTHRDLGGDGWCSPTSVAMVLAHAGTLPPGTDVPRAAAEVLDPAYDGTGNWSFNAAWAATLSPRSHVTRLPDLRAAEALLARRIPLVASVAYPDGALRGAPTRGTDGHLLVIRGVTDTGDVVVNDPAAPTERSVRRTYDRGELERAWQHGSGGLVYIVR